MGWLSIDGGRMIAATLAAALLLAEAVVAGWFIHEARQQRDRARRLLARQDRAMREDARRIRVLRDDNARLTRQMESGAETIRALRGDLDWARITIAVQAMPTQADRMALLGNVVPIRGQR